MNFISTFDELSKLYEEAAPAACNKEGVTDEEAPIEIEEAVKTVGQKLVVDYRPAFEKIAKDVDGKFEFMGDLTVDNDKIIMAISRAIDKNELSQVINAMNATQTCKENSWEAVYTGMQDDKNIVIQFERTTASAMGEAFIIEAATAKTLSEADDEEVEIIDDEMPAEETSAEDGSRQVICECDKCGALVIIDEADVIVDEETDLVNVETECQFCEEAKGFKIIGVVAPYEVVEEPVEYEEAELDEAVDPVLDKITQELVSAGYEGGLFYITKTATGNFAIAFDDEKYNEKDLVADLKVIIDKLGFTGMVEFMGDRIEISHFEAKGA